MSREERIEKAVDYLQRRITTEFEYPFKVFYEDGGVVFRMQNGKTVCNARLKQAEELIDVITGGRPEVIDSEVNRIFEIMRAAVTAQGKEVFDENADYETIRNHLILRPLNYQRVKDELVDVPHFKIGGIALALYAVMARCGSDYFTAKIHRRQADKWQKTEKDVLFDALANTAGMYQPRLYSVEDLLDWDCHEPGSGVFMGEGVKREFKKNMRGYILTNTLEINGAISAFYPGVAEKISEMLEDDFYLGFTSIHETQVHPVRMIEPEIIRNSLRDTNKHCNRSEEILTNTVYCYNREKKCFGTTEGDVFMPLAWEMGKAG